MVPTITLYALVPGHPGPGPRRPGPPDRVPGRELRRDRLRLTRPAERRARPARPRPLGGLVRLTHPFPSLLDGAVVAAVVALIAGADAVTALRLGVSMTALQVSIGTLNDIVDAPRDAGHKPGKPIPAGLVSPADGTRRGGRRGRGRASPWRCRRGRPTRRPGRSSSSPSATATTWSSRARPGRGCRSRSGSRCCRSSAGSGRPASLPRSFAILIPVAVVAGAALAIANARADSERDAAAGVDSVATRLGARAVVAVNAACWPSWSCRDRDALGGRRQRRRSLRRPRSPAWSIAFGLVLGRDRDDPARRERAWELEAVGVGLARRGLAGGDPARASESSRRSVARGPGRSRSRAGAWRSSGTWRGWPGRSPRSSRGPRRCRGPRPARRPRRPGSAWR